MMRVSWRKGGGGKDEKLRQSDCGIQTTFFLRLIFAAIFHHFDIWQLCIPHYGAGKSTGALGIMEQHFMQNSMLNSE